MIDQGSAAWSVRLHCDPTAPG